MNKETFEKEINICREQYSKKRGCNWGECEKCGVVPLLHKLFNGEVVEDAEAVMVLRNKCLQND